MRNKIASILGALAFLVALPARANDIEPGKEFYNATRLNKAITVDGDLTEWTGIPVLSDPKFAIPKGSGANGTYVLFEPYQGGTWTGPDDHTSAVQVAWDANNVYFGFVVTDEYHENAANSAWNGDSVQLMLANNDRTVEVSLVNYALGGVEGALGDVIVNHERGAVVTDPAAETIAVVKRDAAKKKTYYEIKLPAAAFALTAPLTAGTKFGLGMAINDGDEATPGQKGWGGLGAHSIVFGKTPGETALITLSTNAPTVDRIFLSAIAPTGDTFTFRATDKGSSIVDAASAKLTVDGKAAALTSKKTGDATDFTHTFSPKLAEGSDHTYAIEVKDTAGNAVTDQGTFKVAVKPVELPVGTLYIEAEDFNYGKGQYIKDQPIGMTGKYAGGAYQDLGDGLGGAVGDGSDLGIDYLEISTGSDQAIYRPNTGVEAGKRGDAAAPPASGLKRAGFDVEVNHVVGWTAAGEWMNYTRQFPNTPNQLYKVYARMAGGDDGQPIRNGQLSRVTSDPTKPNQTTEVLGTFNAPYTRGWDTWPADGGPSDALIPMKDAAGAEALVKLSGLQTLRFTFLPGASDLDYIAFVPAGTGGLPPKVLSMKPANNATGLGSQPAIEANIEDADLTVASASLTFDGAPVSAAVTKAGKVTTVKYTPPTPLAAGSSHKFALIYTDSGTPATTRTNEVNFKVSFTPFPANTLFIEAEDFNFDKGQWIKDKPIGMTGPYPGGDYRGKGTGVDGAPGDGSDLGIDYFESAANNDGGAVPAYRPTTGVEAAKPNGPAGLNRGSFDVSVNHTVGWTGDGEWLNYTRVFPTNNYKVFARMASGEATQPRNAQLSRVTSDPSKPDQTTQVLGTFNGPWTGGWDTWPDAGTPADALLPLKDAAGNAVVVPLGGQVTLRYTFLPGATDIDYLAFLPQDSGGGTGPKFSSIKRNANGSITIEWSGGGTLQAAPTITGPWADVAGAASPYTFTPAAGQPALFGRLRQ